MTIVYTHNYIVSNIKRFHRFIDRGEFGEVYQGCAMDILGPETGPTPVAVKVNYYFGDHYSVDCGAKAWCQYVPMHHKSPPCMLHQQ